MKKIKYIFALMLLMAMTSVFSQQTPGVTLVDETGPVPVEGTSVESVPDLQQVSPAGESLNHEISAPKADLPLEIPVIQDETMPPVKKEPEEIIDLNPAALNEQPKGPDEATGPIELKPIEKSF
jgi:hypothetical protein